MLDKIFLGMKPFLLQLNSVLAFFNILYLRKKGFWCDVVCYIHIFLTQFESQQARG